MATRFKIFFVVGLIVLIGACSAHPKRVDCERHLQAINTPAPLKNSGTVHP